jgi:hypothetical protein
MILVFFLSAGMIFQFVPVADAMPFDTIKGFVVDEDGNPVPDANVSFWQDGQLVPCNMGNPQQSRYFDDIKYYSTSSEYVGMFWLGEVYPGNYTIRAEKQGYTGSTTVNVTPVEVHYAFAANVTLAEYHVPVLTPQQRNLTGGIAGVITGENGTAWPGVKVTLWQGGNVVLVPGNPQKPVARSVEGREVNYQFDHLAPGQYTVVFEYRGLENETKNISVNVTDRPVMADIVLSNLIPVVPLNDATPSPPPSPLPTTGPDTLLILSSIGAAFLVISRRLKIK